ncbi:GNAT family N-acetyltransferase [Sporosarcina sp. A2]|uniref:GNAT family N-acetyltransferase n=1 Tax=Sporosarcina sp. A2 TaxID=3393449 RepID=UPI003D798723
MLIREVQLADAELLQRLISGVESSSDYMLFESGERTISVEQLKARISSIETDSQSEIFMAEMDSELLGYLMAIGGNSRRTLHTVYLVIGISANSRGKGIGTQLFKYLEKWAYEHKIHRMELTVAKPNDAGIRLYKKMQFEIEGIKRNSLYIDGEYIDEYYMSKFYEMRKVEQVGCHDCVSWFISRLGNSFHQGKGRLLNCRIQYDGT